MILVLDITSDTSVHCDTAVSIRWDAKKFVAILHDVLFDDTAPAAGALAVPVPGELLNQAARVPLEAAPATSTLFGRTGGIKRRPGRRSTW